MVEFRELLNVPPLTNLRVGWCKVQHQQEHLSIAWISKVTDSPSNLELEKTSQAYTYDGGCVKTRAESTDLATWPFSHTK